MYPKLNPKSIGALLAVLSCCAPLPAATPAPRRPSAPLSADWIEYLDRKALAHDFRFTIPQALLERYFSDQRRLQESGGVDYPFDVLITHWSAQVAIGESTSATLQTAATVFRAAPARPVYWKILPKDAAFRQAELNGKPVELRTIGDWRAVLLTAPGRYRLTAQLPLLPARAGDERSVELRQAGAVIATVGVESKQALEFQIDGAPGLLRGDAAGTRGTLATGALDPLMLRWRPARGTIARQGLPLVTPAIAWSCDEQALRARALLDARIIQGPLEQLELRLPAGAERVNVRGGDVRDFRRSGEQLKIFFNGAVEGRTRLELEFELPRPKGDRLDLPELGVAGGRLADEGWLLLANEAGGELLENRIEGLVLSDPRELPEYVRDIAAVNPLFVYKRTSRNAAASFDWFNAPPFPMTDTICDQLTITSVLRLGGEEVTRLELRLRNRSRQFLRLRLPPDARLISLRVEDQPRRAGRDGGDWLIPLEKSLQTIAGLISFPVELIYCRQNRGLENGGAAALDWPVLVGVPAARARATVYLPEGLDVREARSVLERVTAFESGGGETLTYGYGYSTQPQTAPAIAAAPAPEQPHPARKSEKGISRFDGMFAWPRSRPHRAAAEAVQAGGGPAPTGAAFAPASAELAAADREARPPAEAEALSRTNLGRNYYELGYRAYKERRLSEAEEYLNEAIAAAPEAQFAADARNLLSNFAIVAGKPAAPASVALSVSDGANVSTAEAELPAQAGQPQDKTQRARAAQIKRELQADVGELESVRRSRFESGLEQLARGERTAGLQALKQAQQAEEELRSRGLGPADDAAIDRPAAGVRLGDELKQLEEAEIANVKLKKQLETLQERSKQVLLADGTGAAPAQHYFARRLEQSAIAEQLDAGAVFNLALGLNKAAEAFDADGKKPAGAGRGAGQAFGAGAFSGGNELQDIARDTLAENRLLGQNVRVLERALEQAQLTQARQPAPSQAEIPAAEFFSGFGGTQQDSLAALTYDPTNGTISAGDVLRAGNVFTVNGSGQYLTAWSIGEPEIISKYVTRDQLRQSVQHLVEQLREHNEKSSVILEQIEQQLNEAEQVATLTRLPQSTSAKGETAGEFEALRRQLAEGRKLLAERREQFADAINVEFDVSNIVGADNPGLAGQLADFLFSNNYIDADANSAGTETQVAYTGGFAAGREWVYVTNGNLSARNWGDNAGRVREALSALERNDGQVIALAGRNLPLSHVSKNPQTSGWFGQTLNNGVPYAILDEAQFRILQNLARGSSAPLPPEAQAVASRQFDLICGGSATFGALEIGCQRAGIDSNGLTIGRTDLDLPQQSYLCLDNGGYLTVLKTGAARDWREPAPAALIPESAELRYELPLIGRPLHFEKTFLAAGEAPGVLIEYSYKEHRK